MSTRSEASYPKKITPAQCRMARSALQWGVREIAAKAGVAPATITRFEKGKNEPQLSTLAVIKQAFEEAGIVFVENGIGPGVHLKK